MPSIYTIMTTVWLSVLCTCQAGESQTITMVRDCTGSYLRINEKDYQLCNPEMLTDFADGSTLHLEYQLVDSCKEQTPSGPVCAMYHEKEGWVYATKTLKD